MPFYFDEEEFIKKSKKSSSKKSNIFIEESGCDFCDLQNHCKSPKMEPYGKNKLNIMIVGEAPGSDEDDRGRPFVGQAGSLLRDYFDDLEIDIDRDCLITNVVQCRPKNNAFPPNHIAKNCFPRLKEQILETKPIIIYAMGGKAIQTLLFDAPKRIRSGSGIQTTMWGRVVPSKIWNCWVVCCYHPSYINRIKNAEKNREWTEVKFKEINKIYKEQLLLGLDYYNEELPEILI